MVVLGSMYWYLGTSNIWLLRYGSSSLTLAVEQRRAFYT